MTVAPAGWYPDPSMAATQRYWDGAAWTDHRAPVEPAPAPAAPSSSLFVVGFVLALLFPLVGFIIGVVMLGRPRETGSGLVVLLLSVAAGGIYYAALTGQLA